MASSKFLSYRRAELVVLKTQLYAPFIFIRLLQKRIFIRSFTNYRYFLPIFPFLSFQE